MRHCAVDSHEVKSVGVVVNIGGPPRKGAEDAKAAFPEFLLEAKTSSQSYGFSRLFLFPLTYKMPETRQHRQEESNVSSIIFMVMFRIFSLLTSSLVGLQGCPPRPRNLLAGSIRYQPVHGKQERCISW